MTAQSNQKVPVQDTTVPNYPFSRVSMDLTGLLKTTLSGNKYV
jgi:hypothetical protein